MTHYKDDPGYQEARYGTKQQEDKLFPAKTREKFKPAFYIFRYDKIGHGSLTSPA